MLISFVLIHYFLCSVCSNELQSSTGFIDSPAITSVSFDLEGNYSVTVCSQTNKVCNASSILCNCIEKNVTISYLGSELSPNIEISNQISSTFGSLQNFINTDQLDWFIFRSKLSEKRKKRDGTSNTDGIDFNLRGTDLIISADYSPETCTVLVSNAAFHQSYQFSRIHDINANIAYSTDVIEIEIICSGSIVVSTNFRNYPQGTCQEINYSDFRCMSTTLKAFSIIGLIIAVILFLGVLIKLIMYLHNIFKNSSPAIDEAVIEISELSSSSSSDEMKSPVTININQSKVTEEKKKTPGIQVKNLALLLILLCSVPNVKACDNSIIMSSTNSECFHSTENSIRCFLNTNVDLTFPGINSKVCLYFKDDKTNMYVHNLNFTLLSSVEVFQLNLEYYTARSFFGLAASRTCSYFGNYGCNGGFCDDMPELDHFLQHQQCIPSCGCAGCGCAVCDDACTYVNWSRIFQREISKSLKPVIGTKFITIGIDNATMGNYTEMTFTSPIVRELNENSFISLVSTYTPHPSLYDLHIAELDGNTAGPGFSGFHYFIVPDQLYSIKNFPMPNIFGDVQCGDVTCSTGKESPYTPIFYAGSSSVQYFNAPIPFSLLSSGIPQINSLVPYKGYQFLANSTTLVASAIQTDPTTLNFKIEGNYQVEVLVNQICPIIVSLEAFGCYLCSGGFIIKMIAKSTIESGLVELTSNYQIQPNSIYITPEESQFDLKGYSFLKELNIDITLTGTYCKSTQSLVTVLNDPPLLNSTIDDINNIVKTNSNSFNNWWNSLTGSAVALKVLFVFGLGCICAIIVSFIVLAIKVHFIDKSVKEMKYGPNIGYTSFH